MFINFWYVAEESKNVSEAPVYSRLLGQDFVVFRDTDGTAHVLSNVCVHRGGSLSNGKIKGDCVECPYHGWQFDGSGQCTRVPSLGPDAKIPSRAKIDSYPTEERYGLVFAFLGDLPEEERPPIMDVLEWEQDGWRPTFLIFDWDFDYKRSLDNALDPSHNEFVHTTHIDTSSGQNFAVPDLELIEKDWGPAFDIEMPSPPLHEEKMREVSGRDKPAPMHIRAGTHGVSSFWTYIEPNPRFMRRQYFYETPIEEGQTRMYSIDMRSGMLDPQDDARMIQMDTLVAEQDAAVLRNIRPVVTPRTNNKETFVPSDRHVARYRELLSEWESLGWRIDLGEVRRTSGSVAYAIPSPARRQSRGWALDPIPLLPGKKSRISRAAE